MKETVNFVSGRDPIMNSFLLKLQKALKNLPNNPKPDCEGFYLCYYNPRRNLLTSEKIGFVPVEKDLKYLHFSTKKVTQTLLKNAMRSAEFANNELEQYPGAFVINRMFYGNYCAGVSGHDSMVDEAIAVLWLITKKIISESTTETAFTPDQNFFIRLKNEAEQIQKDFAPDNQWINPLAFLLADDGGK